MIVFSYVPWWLWFLIGFIVGTIVGVKFLPKPRDGSIYVTERGESDNLLFEFNISPEKIPRMKDVNFKVQIVDDPSQKLQTP